MTVNHLVLTLAPPGGWTPTAAFVLATGCSATANFLGQRSWVFRGHTTELSP